MSEETTEHSRKMPKGVKDGMIKVSGKDYLPVPFRLVWMRDEKPLWGISTEVIEAAGYAMVRATVTDETGRVIASAHKALTAGGKFPPIEKAETGAMGRALGAAGFGTQFGELDEEEPGVMGGIADSPVSRTGNMNKKQASDMLKARLDDRGYAPADKEQYMKIMRYLENDKQPEFWTAQDFLRASELPQEIIDDAIKAMYVPSAAEQPLHHTKDAAAKYQSPASAIKESLNNVA